ncbi:hypothetical protein [Herbaspirillum rubrisubalbicans]|uniref:hypothetical protein n=2 Tax=Herbaspirillum TaxID=963 RepID=UPI0015C551D0|nr:hypothetical protein [Herbaspirillum rubrisubalbicans]
MTLSLRIILIPYEFTREIVVKKTILTARHYRNRGIFFWLDASVANLHAIKVVANFGDTVTTGQARLRKDRGCETDQQNSGYHSLDDTHETTPYKCEGKCHPNAK